MAGTIREVDATSTTGGRPKPRILVVNPNTSDSLTNLLVDAATRRAAGRASVTGVSAPFGSASLDCPADLIIAAHAVLEAIATAPPADAIIIGAFGDPGRTVAADLADVPVLGLAQSGMMAAAEGGRRFAILTLGSRLEPSIRRAVSDAGVEKSLLHIGFLAGQILDFAADRSRFADSLIAAAMFAITDLGAEAILFGGAPFAGIGDEIGDRVPVPVFDGLTSAVDLSLQQLGPQRNLPRPDYARDDFHKRYAGISHELALLISKSKSG